MESEEKEEVFMEASTLIGWVQRGGVLKHGAYDKHRKALWYRAHRTFDRNKNLQKRLVELTQTINFILLTI